MDTAALIAIAAAALLGVAALLMGQHRAAWTRFGWMAGGIVALVLSLWFVQRAFFDDDRGGAFFPLFIFGFFWFSGLRGVPGVAKLGVVLGVVASAALVSALLTMV